MKLADTFIFDEMPVWREVLTQPEPERSRRLSDPAWRARMQSDWDADDGRAVAFDLGELEIEGVSDPAHHEWVGRSVSEIAQERGHENLDVLLDLSLAENLELNLRTRNGDVAKQFIHHVVETGIACPIAMAGSSDGGAHLASFTGADYSTRLLSEWVPKALTLEQAIWRLAGMPATVHGLKDRGFLRTGAYADVVIFDPERLKSGDAYLARDFPADTERYVISAEGYKATLINGQVVIEGAKHTGVLSGHVLRGC